MTSNKHFVMRSGHHHGGGTRSTPRLHDLLAPLIFAGQRRRSSQLTAVSGVRPGDRVLDVGCGAGDLTRIIAGAVGPNGSAVGLDPSIETLERARQATTAVNCTFVEGRAEGLEFPDTTFDVVVTSLMIHHLADEQRPPAVREMFRVLRPGGRVLIADFRPPTNALLRRAIHLVVSQPMSHNSVRMLESMVHAAGFQSVAIGKIPPWIHYVTGVKPA
jgi:ubiquinone/menaquinone biosynthesis C-methylase UbiE